MPDIVISEFMDQTAVDALDADFDVLYSPDLVDRGDELKAAVADARALIVRNRTQVRGDLLDSAVQLAVVGRLGVGLDNIDLDACRERRIKVCPASGANNTAVAEYVIATAMLLLRGAYASSAAVSAGDWPRQSCIGRELAGKLMGLLGFGAIARETSQRARALGMRVIAYDPFVAPDNLVWTGVTRAQDIETVLAQADVVSLHVPLSAATRDLIDSAAISQMKKNAVLINSSRGGVVDEAAAVAALQAGQLGGVALDVFVDEPLDASAGARFPVLPNLILSPHIAGVTEESNVRVSAVTAANVRRVLERTT